VKAASPQPPPARMLKSAGRMADVKERMSGANRTRLVLFAAVLVVAAAVWVVSETQRATAERVFDESQAADRMLTAMLDQETGVRGFIITRERPFLQPFIDGVRDFNLAADDARSFADDETRPAIDRMERTANRWRTSAEQEVGRAGLQRNYRFDRVATLHRKTLFDDFRRQITDFTERLANERRDKLARAGWISVAVIVLLGLLFGGLGFVLLERQVRRSRARRTAERDYRRTQSEFIETMQIMRDEPEAHALVKQHLERTIEGSEALVLTRNNSDNRLNAATTVTDDSAIAAKLVDAEPESCLAVRLGRPYRQHPGDAPLLTCDLCGASADEIVCTPSLVGGEVIGSVLLRSAHALGPSDCQRVEESVSQAAPVLANLRNLAIAENRAATDALTGLPNSRSCRDNLKRMVAHAGRTVAPMSAVMFDLDHFKQVNDRFGHGAGDDVLAAVGEALRATLRDSDFGGRYGGEEFLMLLPGTGQSGAQQVAEKLRTAIEALEFQQPELSVTASFGIATYPLDALDADGLVRMSDRALYAAKARGRNRIELIDSTPDREHQPQDGYSSPS
jgi:diguanylate cyclase (GGDEF)-like protein